LSWATQSIGIRFRHFANAELSFIGQSKFSGRQVNTVLVKRIIGSSQLPTLPVVALKVLELTRRDDVSVPEIADLIMCDGALASKILKTVNSPFYGLTKQVGTISGALVILGLQAAKTLALGFSLLTHLKTHEKGEVGFDHVRFWKRSVYAAVGSRVLARRFSVVQQEEAFLAGLLANLGVLALHRVMPAEFDVLYREAKGSDGALQALCRKKFDLTPAEVGKALAEKWQLPALLAEPIALQQMPEQAEAGMRPLVEAVSAGLIIADVFVAEDSAGAITAARGILAERFKLLPEEVEKVLQEISASAKEASAMLDVNLETERSYQEILDEAQETLVSLSLQNQKRVETIQRQVETLQVRAMTDSLTQLANRARFDEFLQEQFNIAYAQGKPLALIFIDLDHFKAINDTYGHQAGDEVLRHVGRILRASIRGGDLVARYGGEEFAAVLTETDTETAAQRAEGIRLRLAAEPIVFEEREIRATLSAGVAGTDGRRVFSRYGQLTNASDRAVYAAKAAGRNCVRVFRPQGSTRGTGRAPARAAVAVAK
jgi:diguanylate cyclase (GGDEF)-like protein